MVVPHRRRRKKNARNKGTIIRPIRIKTTMNSVEFNRYVLYMCVNILTESRKNKKTIHQTCIIDYQKRTQQLAFT